jgi:hypothetical protein
MRSLADLMYQIKALLRTVDVDEDARISGRVRAGEANSRGRGGTAAAHGELVAAHVELSTANAASYMKSDN